jgi:replicative DNA helicase
VIGAVMLWPGCLDELIDAGMRAQHFYRPVWANAFGTAIALAACGEPIDVHLLAAELLRQGLDWPEMGGDLTSAQAGAPGRSGAVAYARLVRDLAVRRAVIAAGAELVDAGYDPRFDVDELRDRAESVVLAATERVTVEAAASLGEVLAEAIEEVEARARGERHGVPTGFVDLDRPLGGGMRRGQLLLLAARPSMGKSALALDIALNAARAEHRVLFLAVEMGRLELGERMLAGGGVASDRVLRGQLDTIDRDRLRLRVAELAGLPVVIDDDASTSVLGLRAKARRMIAKGGLGVIVVDYLQLMRSEAGDRHERREQAVAAVSRGLKQLARDLAVPVLAVAQVNRAVELRPDKRPTLSDLRESGQLEADADIVMLLHRPSVYDPDEDAGLAQVHIAKHRNGPTGTVELAWIAHRMSFADAARPRVEP